MTVLIVQNDFTHGEFDPKLISRFNIALYNKAAKKLRNVMVITQGGAKRRAGTIFNAEITGVTADQFKLVEFELTEDISYLFVFTNNNVAVYKAGVFQVNIVTTWPGADIRALKVAQTENLMIVSHVDHEPREIKNLGTDTTWSLADVAFKFLPAHDFTKDYFTSTFTLSPQSIGKNRDLDVTGGPFTFTGANVNYVGGVFIAAGNSITDPIGFARITSISSATKAKVQIVSTFAGSLGSDTDGKEVVLGEQAWSTNTSPTISRGWPNAVTFYQDRLFFGGSKSLTQTLFGSKIGDFANFEISTGLDDDAIIEEMATNKLNNIKHLVADRTLQVFTGNAEFAPLQLSNEPITPGTFSITKQTNNGSTAVDPVVIDNQTFYVKRGGKGVMAFVFDDNTRAYQSTEASLFSPQVIDQPIDSAVLKGSTRDDSDFFFLINNDGSMAIYQTREAQEVSAWTLATTDGQFKGGVQVGDNLVLLVQRTIEGSPKLYIETFDFDIFTDSAKIETFGSPTATITGLSHLEGQLVRVRGDGFVWPSQTVAGGQITIKDEQGNDQPVSSVEVGLNFDTLIEPLPVVVQASDGTTAYIPKRLVRIFVDYFDSLGVFIQDVLIPHREFGPNVLDKAPEPQTGIEEFRDLGWSRRPNVTIKQVDPLPMTILAIGYEVEI
jgi:hypothetical protein